MQRTPGFGLVLSAAIVAGSPDADVPDRALIGSPTRAASALAAESPAVASLIAQANPIGLGAARGQQTATV